MKYSYKIFISIVIILSLGFWGYGYWLMKEVRSQYALTIEDSLVDFSNILASYLSAQSDKGFIKIKDFDEAFKNFKKTNFSANIHGVVKGESPIQAYITDSKGIIVYDSRNANNIGEDYSQWNDVYLTLQGKYGARSTRVNSSDPLSSIFYVAAPIQYEDRIIGSVSVIKPEQSLRSFMLRGRQKIILITILVLITAILLAALFSFWLTRPINALTKYAQKITKGASARPPKSTSTEFNNLAQAFDEMRISLEGKKSIESFVQHLVHELKSPLSAIQGAAELLQDDMPDEKRDLFLSNINSETQRAKKQLDELLNLASLESRSSLVNPSHFSIKKIILENIDALLSLVEQKKLKVNFHCRPENIQFFGEQKLISQVISSVLVNAIQFSPENGEIQIDVTDEGKTIKIYIRDQGPGVPEYAKNKIFDKFYSLERPSTGKKSTGLGLSFVKEALALHSGRVQLEPSTDEMPGVNLLISLNK